MRHNQIIKYFLLFVIAFLFFAYLQNSPTLPDPDSFYHAKIAVLIRDQGIVKDFPWLQFTVLKDYYTDHHLLYHIALVPFVSVMDPLAGIKLATTIFGALLILLFCWFLEKFKIKNAFFYSLILLATSPFIFRINLAKASALSIIFLLTGLYFIFKRKYWPLFILSFAYVWLFAGWPLIFVLTSLYIFSDTLIKTIKNFTTFKKWGMEIKNFLQNIFSKDNLKLFLSCSGGLLAGLIINPYFPKNLFFYWYQIVRIAIINYQEKIGVGAEWYPYNFGDLVANSSFVFILLILALTVLFINFIEYFTGEKKHSMNDDKKTQILTLFLLTIFFLSLTLRSRRNVEYFTPFAMLFGAFSLNQLLSLWDKYWLAFQKWWQQKKVLAIALCLFFVIVIPFTVGRNIWSVKKLFKNGNSIYKYQGIANWLKNNTPEGAIIFHNDWDDFPPLFYYNTNNYYIAGLDPTFMYDYNKNLHKKWVDITTGKQDNISEIVKGDFNSQYVFVDKDHIALENNLKRDGNFTMVYKDEEGKIYQLTNN